MLTPFADWRDDYREKRPYGHLTEEQLCDRYSALLQNMVQFDSSGLPFVARTGRPYWTKRFCWTEAEFELRSLLPLARGLERAELSRSRPSVVAASKLWADLQNQPVQGSYVVKFGKAQHVREMLSAGRFRIAPATWYADPSLNPAQRDDELTVQEYAPNGTRLSVKIEGEFKEIRQIIGPLCHHRSCDNYYVFCAAGTFDARLFDAFDADACLLVRDLQRFGLALLRGFAAVAGMTEALTDSVKYVDPLHPQTHLVEVSKHFRYEYQKEWRIAWKQDQPLSDDAQPIFVELGSLADCCEALYL